MPRTETGRVPHIQLVMIAARNRSRLLAQHTGQPANTDAQTQLHPFGLRRELLSILTPLPSHSCAFLEPTRSAWQRLSLLAFSALDRLPILTLGVPRQRISHLLQSGQLMWREVLVQQSAGFGVCDKTAVAVRVQRYMCDALYAANLGAGGFEIVR